MPTIALTLCSILVIIFLYIEHRSSSGISLVIWIPTIAMLISASRPLGRWFIQGGEDLDQPVLVAIILISIYIIHRREIPIVAIFKNNLWLSSIIFYAGVSIFWSEIPFISFKRWIRFTGGIIVAIVILGDENPFKCLESILRRCAYTLIPFSLVLAKYYPLLGRGYARWSGLTHWTGVTLQKNSLGLLCAISIIFLIWSIFQYSNRENDVYLKRRKYADIFTIIIAIYLLFGAKDSYSATSTVMIGFGIAIQLILLKRKNLAIKIARNLKVLVLTAVGLIAIFYEIIIWMLSGVLARKESLTGRTEIWNILYDYIMENPVVGVGYGGFYAPDNIDIVNLFSTQFIITTAHSGYLAVWTELGIVGLILIFFFILSLCEKIKNQINISFPWAILGICFIVISIFYNYTEVSFIQSGNYLWSCIIYTTIAFSQKKNLEKLTVI